MSRNHLKSGCARVHVCWGEFLRQEVLKAGRGHLRLPPGGGGGLGRPRCGTKRRKGHMESHRRGAGPMLGGCNPGAPPSELRSCFLKGPSCGAAPLGYSWCLNTHLPHPPSCSLPPQTSTCQSLNPLPHSALKPRFPH